jgi:hypothetical protein
MTLSAAGLCAQALLRLGAQPLSSLDEGTSEAAIAAGLYPLARDALLSAHSWSFAMRQARLARLDMTPLADFRAVFALPDDFIRALSAGHQGRSQGIAYRVQGATLLADAEEAILSYVARVDEAAFPPFFAQALVARLAAEFCGPVTENAARAEALFRQADAEFRRARMIDATQDEQPRLDDFTLIKARFS